MSDGGILDYAAALAAGGLLLLIIAVLGLGQGIVLRVLDVLLGLAFLGYAGYLMVVDPDSPFVSWFVLITPVAALIVGLVAQSRARAKLRRLAEAGAPSPYAGHDATGHAERQPFPSAPPPLGPPTKASAKKAKQAARAEGMPSGLPDTSGLPSTPPAAAAPRPGRPSGLPPMHAEPNYHGKHEAADDETAHHDYSGGRHRSDSDS